MIRIASALCAGALLAATAGAASAGPVDRKVAIDALFADWNRPDTPGCAVGVIERGALVFAKGYGQANLSWRVPNAPDTLFPIGSNSKQFTAMAVLLLAEEGKLSLDDDVRKFLPELPAYDPPVLIRHLLHHTGGLRDYQALRFLSGVPPEHVVADEVLALIARQRGVDAAAGTRFDYDNTGYVLLRYVVERLTALRFVDFVRTRIFEPLGMTHSRWLEDFQTVVPRLATAYDGDAATGFRAAYSIPVAGSGGVVTTIGDLALWQSNFEQNRLGRRDPALIARELAPGTLDNGEPLGYAAGLFLGEYRGHNIVWHAGHGPGYVADLVRFPAERLSVLCLCNGLIDSRLLSRRVADLFLPEGPIKPRAPEAPVASIPPAEPPAPADSRALVGNYLSASNDIWKFVDESGILVLRRGEVRMELAPIAPLRFRSLRPDWKWEFDFDPADASGRSPRVTETDTDGAFVFTRLPAPPAGAALDAYLGRFDDDELLNPYSILRDGEGLRLDTAIQPKGPLVYVGPDHFLLASPFFTLDFRFSRGAHGAVDGFVLDAGAASGFRFLRLDGPETKKR